MLTILRDRRITLHFKMPNGEIETVEANEGDDIVDVSWEYDLDIEGKHSNTHHPRLPMRLVAGVGRARRRR